MSEAAVAPWASPLAWLTLTLAAYLVGLALYRRAGHHPTLHPVGVAAALLAGLLVASGTDVDTYLEGGRFVHFLLGPATVALAVPTFLHLREVRRSARPLALALLAGSLTAIVTATATVWLLGGSEASMRSIAPKSVTTPVAMGVAASIGGLPSLTAAIVVVTGIVGAILASPVCRAVGVRGARARGFATGVAAHGIGTARAFHVSARDGAFSGLGMGLNALLTSALVPLLAAALSAWLAR